MSKPTIEKTIEIQAGPGKVWRVFTDPVISRQIGGEYVTDWKVGSSFSWKGLDGTILTNGEIILIEPEKRLKYKQFDLNDTSRLLAVITYKLTPNAANTILSATEELNYEMPEDELQEASNGWDFALNAVKETAEKL